GDWPVPFVRSAWPPGLRKTIPATARRHAPPRRARAPPPGWPHIAPGRPAADGPAGWRPARARAQPWRRPRDRMPRGRVRNEAVGTSSWLEDGDGAAQGGVHLRPEGAEGGVAGRGDQGLCGFDAAAQG